MLRTLIICLSAVFCWTNLFPLSLWAEEPAGNAEKVDLAVWNAVQQALQKPVKADFVEVPLKEAAAKLGEQLGLTIGLDEKALAAEGFDPDSPVTLHIANKSGRSALRTMLRDFQLFYILRKNGVVITTFDTAEQSMEIWREDLSDLVALDSDIDFEQLIRIIQYTIKPSTWDEVGGAGSVKLDETGGVRELVFKQSLEVHEEANDFLALFRKLCRLAQQRKLAHQSAVELAAGKISPKDFVPSPPPFATLSELGTAETAIRNALKRNLAIDYSETPLLKVVESLREKLRIPIELDAKSLIELGITGETLVTKKIAGIPAKSALRLLLKDLGLTYMIRDEALLITTPDAADTYLSTQIFEVTDLASPNDATLGGDTVETLLDLIVTNQHPTTWDEVGGCGSLEPLFISDSRFLVVSQTQEVHEDIFDLLEALRAVRHPVQSIAPVKESKPIQSDDKEPRGIADRPPIRQVVDQPCSARPNEKIRRALEKPITLKFQDAPLADIARQIGNLVAFPILVDSQSLNDLGLTPDTELSLDVKDVKLREALDSLFAGEELAWTVRDDILLITTKDDADFHLETRVFDVCDLPAFRRGDGKTMPDYEQLILAITKSIEPETWDEVGGPGTIETYDAGGVQALVVTQSWAVQERILLLLENVRTIRKWPLDREEIEKLPPAPPPKPKEKLPFPPAFGDPLPFAPATGEPPPNGRGAF
jgi:hypothetical protein